MTKTSRGGSVYLKDDSSQNNSQLATAILQKLTLRPGKRNAIPGHILAAELGESNDRQIRKVIRQLITYGYPIASSVGDPKGYFLCTNLDEARDYARGLRDRLIEDAIRRRDFLRSTHKYIQRETQGTLALGGK